MFLAKLTISKIACEKTPSSQLGVFVPGLMNFSAARELNVLASSIRMAVG